MVKPCQGSETLCSCGHLTVHAVVDSNGHCGTCQEPGFLGSFRLSLMSLVEFGSWALITSCWQAIHRTGENQAEQYCYPFKNCVSVVFVDFTGNMESRAPEHQSKCSTLPNPPPTRAQESSTLEKGRQRVRITALGNEWAPWLQAFCAFRKGGRGDAEKQIVLAWAPWKGHLGNQCPAGSLEN